MTQLRLEWRANYEKVGGGDPDQKKYNMLNWIIWKLQIYSKYTATPLVIEFVQQKFFFCLFFRLCAQSKKFAIQLF